MKRTAKILLAVTALATAPSMAQNTSTPYSMYGFGILSDHATSMQRQMGGVGIAQNSGRQINVINPASYAAMDSLTFLFDLGADVTMLWSKEGSAKDYSTGGGVDYATMQFPISKHFGGSFGLLPYSSVGYAFGNDIAHGTRENQGSGGINELYLGFAGEIKGFSLGFNISYNFGNIVNDVFSTASGSTNQSKFEHVMEIRDWGIVLGAQYTIRPSRFSKLVAGVTYSPKKTLLGNSRSTLTLLSNGSTATLDTVGSLKLRDNYYTPNMVGAGISYTFEKSSRIMVEADFKWEGWKDCRYSPMYSDSRPDVVIFQGMEFNNRTRYALGAEYVPRLRGNYGQRINYRLGGYYCNDYLKILGNSVREYGVTGGFGFPTPEGKTMINLGIEWKHRQAHPAQLISENYLMVSLGVNFNEVWFFKRKIK